MRVPGKVNVKIKEKRIRRIVENTLEEEQYGFRPNRSTQDLIFTMRQIMEKVIDKGKSVSICYVDVEKAFDRVRKLDIINALREKGVHSGLVLAVKSLYKRTRSEVRFAIKMSTEFETLVDIRQGCSLSPLLFTLVMDKVIKNAKVKTRKFHLGNLNLRRVRPCLSIVARVR